MTVPPSYRQLAERSLGQAAAAANEFPTGPVNAAEMQARAAAAQAVATIAAVQALLDIAEAIRETR
jgi:hypothetical protein